MSDPQTREDNERALEELFRRKHGLDRRGYEVFAQHLENLAKVNEFTDDFIDATVTTPVSIEGKYTTRSTSNDVIDFRLNRLEEKVAWLVENKISESSEEFLNIIKDEFTLLPFIKEIYGGKTSSGYDLVIVHNEERTNIALSAITQTKQNLKKKLPNIHLELTVIRSSDFNKTEWKSRKLIFQS